MPALRGEDRSPLQVVDITEETLMAGLSCGEVSQIAWSLLQVPPTTPPLA